MKHQITTQKMVHSRYFHDCNKCILVILLIIINKAYFQNNEYYDSFLHTFEKSQGKMIEIRCIASHQMRSTRKNHCTSIYSNQLQFQLFEKSHLLASPHDINQEQSVQNTVKFFSKNLFLFSVCNSLNLQLTQFSICNSLKH